MLADGRLADTDEVQTPTMDGEVDEGDEGGVPAGVDEPLFDEEEGESTLEACSKPQPPTAIAASAAAIHDADL